MMTRSSQRWQATIFEFASATGPSSLRQVEDTFSRMSQSVEVQAFLERPYVGNPQQPIDESNLCIENCALSPTPREIGRRAH